MREYRVLHAGTGALAGVSRNVARKAAANAVTIDFPTFKSQVLSYLPAEAFADRVDPLALPEYVTAPFPSYVSLQSALYLHGMISQLPALTYAVSLARTRRVTTPLGVVSIHHVDPAFFFGFEPAGEGGRLATPEKALVDFLYLRPARSGLFRALPELELPPRFSARRARAIVRRIPSARRRALVHAALEETLARLKNPTDLGTAGRARWRREELHELMKSHDA